jgi:hypothetical protein
MAFADTIMRRTQNTAQAGVIGLCLSVIAISFCGVYWHAEPLIVGRALGHSSLYTRTAYLTTADPNSVRARSSATLLQKIGFGVVFVEVDANVPARISKTKRLGKCKEASMKALQMVLDAPGDAWGYIFQDDIALVDDTDPAGAMEQIVKAETLTGLYNFLGVCGPVPWYKLHDGKHYEHIALEKEVKLEKEKARTCGKCFHAQGVSKRGAAELLKIAAASPMRSIDTIVQGWCVREDVAGFDVVGMELRSPENRNHRGLFYQARTKFESIIGSAGSETPTINHN